MAKKSQKNKSQKTTRKNPSIPKADDGKLEDTDKSTVVSTEAPESTAPDSTNTNNPDDGDQSEVSTASEDSDPEVQKPVAAKKSIPKVNKLKVEKVDPTIVNMDDVIREAQELVDNEHKQLTPEQAVAWSMSQDDPEVAIKRLIKQRRLNSPTDTLKLLHDSQN